MEQAFNMKSASDAELVKRFRETRDKAIVGELFTRYTSMVYGVSMKYLKNDDEAKDAVMQIFEKILNDLHRHDVNNFKSWLYMVVKNHCFMHFRSRKLHVELPKHLSGTETSEFGDGSELESVVPDETGGANNMEWHQSIHLEGEDKERQLTLMESAIAQLKDNQRNCIELFYLQEKSYEEVSKLTGYSMKEVKSYIQNGKRNLKILMQSGSAIINSRKS